MLLEFAKLNLADKGRLYRDLYEHIKTAVEKGALKKGEKLPSVREAAAQLGVSRTTVENAYTKLCIEGFCEALPQKGYFITGAPKKQLPVKTETVPAAPILYDFSSRVIDGRSSDTDLWKRLVRSVLWNNEELNSYGDPQGELGLRTALAEYAYKARGVITAPQNIVIGAGIGPLLNILCGLIGRNITVGFENGGFNTAEHIFSDYGIKACPLESDNNGAMPECVEEADPDILFLLPSALSRLSATSLLNRRNFFKNWAEKAGRLIIEDDYNGELRFTGRSIPAFQGKSPENTVYIGSFSKLLLPSVRIAYMVLPERLLKKFRETAGVYNQTCGKIEQLALEKYISSGALERHLRKLRRIYSSKSRILCSELEECPQVFSAFTLFDSSLTVEVGLKKDINSAEFSAKCREKGLRTAEIKDSKTLRLCFGGISEENIPKGIKLLKEIVER